MTRPAHLSACDFVFGSFRSLVKKGVFVRGIKVEVRKKKEKTNKTKTKKHEDQRECRRVGQGNGRLSRSGQTHLLNQR